jgi:hypothetical protein
VLKTFVGPDAKTSEHYARIVSTQHCERLKSLLADPKSGTAVVGGAVDVANRYVEPTILKDVKYDSRVRPSLATGAGRVTNAALSMFRPHRPMSSSTNNQPRS